MKYLVPLGLFWHDTAAQSKSTFKAALWGDDGEIAQTGWN